MAIPKALEIMSAIHSRVQRDAQSTDPVLELEEWSNNLAQLGSSHSDAYTSRNLVGQTPQLPNLFIAKIAGVLIWFVQKLLFWHTPQVRRFQGAAAEAIGHLSTLSEREFRAHLALAQRVTRIEQELDVRSLDVPGREPASPDPRGKSSEDDLVVDAGRFYFELQRRFQSHAREDAERYTTLLSILTNLKPELPSGPWLDIGCGNGEWAERLGREGVQVIGLDSNDSSVSGCRAKGVEVVQADALEYLRQVDSGSLSAVSAFHVVEHWPFEYTLACMREIARTVAPGGAIVVETPNPANVLMASEQFWLDPTHRRPLPMPLMEFLMEFCGLRLEHRLELNPRPEEEHLPLRSLELAERLDRLFYGPQDYALIARKGA